MLALQSEVARAVARQIEVALGLAERERIELATQPGSARRPDPEAYDAYLKGRYHLARSGQADATETSIRHFEEAIAKDSTFAAAYAGLAEALQYAVEPERVERFKSAGRRAVELDPALPEAHAALGLVRTAEWDWSGSEAAFRRAIELDPNSSVAHQWYAQLLRQTMRPDEALKEARRAEELDPFSLMVKTMVGWVLFNQHRYDQAIRVWDEVLELDPDYGLAIYNQGLAYALKGQGEEVILAAQRAAPRWRGEEGESYTTWLLGVGYAISGQRDRAETIIRQFEARGSTACGAIAVLYLMLGEDDEALDCLERAYELRSPLLPNGTSEPWFDDLRDHPRFRALRAKMGLP